MAAVAPDRITEHLRANYGVQGSTTSLPGEHDDNLLVETGSDRLVLRMVAADQEEQRDRFILSVLAGAEGSSCPCPRLIPTRSGEPAPLVIDDTGRERRSWVTTYVPGSPWGERLDDAELARTVGRALASLDRQLALVTAPEQSGRTPWDLTRPEGTLALIDGVPLGPDGPRIHRYLEDLQDTVLPALVEAGRQPIHNDANPDNVLIQADGGVGFIDFGDAVWAPRVVELAVAGAYLADAGRPASDDAPLTQLIRGYSSELPLSQTDLRALPGLMRGRLALALGNALARAHHHPERADYVLRHAERARRRMDALDALDEDRAMRMWESTGVGT